ncbi:MAG: superoxide dismutase family protein [Novosphingobium sp.]|nr:superoxide dismutase family protein [Novosphingobium sp.]
MAMRTGVGCSLAAGMAVLAALAGPASAARRTTLATATLLAADGTHKGRARVVAIGDRLELKVAVRGLSPGQHGVHLHAMGTCTAPDFTSAGPHLNPAGRMHGSMNPQGSHLGDLPNLEVGRNGRGTITVGISGTPGETRPLLFDADGTAVVIHAAPDDYHTDPAGNAGPRIACGILAGPR